MLSGRKKAEFGNTIKIPQGKMKLSKVNTIIQQTSCYKNPASWQKFTEEEQLSREELSPASEVGINIDIQLSMKYF